MAEMYEDENGDWKIVQKPPTLKNVIRKALHDSLAFSNGQQKKAAAVLGISPRVLNHQMKKYGIPRPKAPYKIRNTEIQCDKKS